MTPQDWSAAAYAAFENRLGVSAGRVRPKVWRDLFILSLSPDDAAERAATLYLNSLSLPDRLRLYDRLGKKSG